VAASELKRPFDMLADPDEQLRERLARPLSFDTAKHAAAGGAPLSAARRGTVTHLLLQHMRLDGGRGVEYVAGERQRIVENGTLDRDDAASIDIDAIAWFLDTPLGRRVRAAGAAFEREVMFLSAEPPDLFDQTVGPGPHRPVVVRGIVDGVLTEDEGLELIDYKTDRVALGDVAARVDAYRFQMQLYARAIARSRQRAVRRCWLVFLHPRTLVPLPQD
jgi:ATP-dependent helicase/nuclease subunit A